MLSAVYEIIPRTRLSNYCPYSRLVQLRGACERKLYGELVVPCRRRVYVISRLVFALQLRLGGGPLRNGVRPVSTVKGSSPSLLLPSLLLEWFV